MGDFFISISAARIRLASLVRKAESGDPIHLTSRGKPVAVLVSADRYADLLRSAPDLPTAIREFREDTDLHGLDVETVFRDVRDRSTAPHQNRRSVLERLFQLFEDNDNDPDAEVRRLKKEDSGL